METGEVFSTFYRDIGATDVVDVTPGSGAACLAALYQGIPYFGFSINDKHKKWFLDIFQKAFLAMVLTKVVTVDKTVFDNVGQYLQRSAEAAKMLLPKDTKYLECETCGDDSMDED